MSDHHFGQQTPNRVVTRLADQNRTCAQRSYGFRKIRSRPSKNRLVTSADNLLFRWKPGFKWKACCIDVKVYGTDGKYA
jgi:hypothetical protein